MSKGTPAWLDYAKNKIQRRIQKIRLLFGGIYFSLFTKTYKNAGVVLHIPFDLTDFKFRGRFALDLYEEEEAKYLSKYLSPNARVLELGSCLGYVSCLVNNILAQKDQHVALEANPNLIPWIEKNREANACHFHLENSIISPNESNIFYIHKLIVGGSTKRETPVKTEIKGLTITQLKEKYNIDFDTLVMDIEGGELSLLRNFKQEIAAFKHIFFEIHPFAGILTQEEAQECEGILKEIGFKMKIRDGHYQIWEK
ncbi:FkbM family methyltransferase [Flagellimonas algicola]|uniref:FkbM family methyltransferase n=1 Tax=Flagellimonas algicola TaxID=2583815 RepID=A0ABY2WIK9_9FLAO|nr:FkbM family methyltransferase [Allomuricauda algicola]TMU54482.1 FkbM family methyltransferase [Allomuricauda algicola]